MSRTLGFKSFSSQSRNIVKINHPILWLELLPKSSIPSHFSVSYIICPSFLLSVSFLSVTCPPFPSSVRLLHYPPVVPLTVRCFLYLFLFSITCPSFPLSIHRFHHLSVFSIICPPIVSSVNLFYHLSVVSIIRLPFPLSIHVLQDLSVVSIIHQSFPSFVHVLHHPPVFSIIRRRLLFPLSVCLLYYSFVFSIVCLSFPSSVRLFLHLAFTPFPSLLSAFRHLVSVEYCPSPGFFNLS